MNRDGFVHIPKDTRSSTKLFFLRVIFIIKFDLADNVKMKNKRCKAFKYEAELVYPLWQIDLFTLILLLSKVVWFG